MYIDIYQMAQNIQIDENKASLTDTRIWVLMQEFLLNICGIMIVSV